MAQKTFIPYEFPTNPDGRFFIGQTEGPMLRDRREQLGMTQQQVADMAGVQLKQYQRLETEERTLSGCSMRIGLAVCAALLLDPYEMVCPDATQPDPKTMKPQRTVDIHMVKPSTAKKEAE